MRLPHAIFVLTLAAVVAGVPILACVISNRPDKAG